MPVAFLLREGWDLELVLGIGNWELCAWNALSLEQVRDTSLNPLFCPFEIFLAYLICFYP